MKQKILTLITALLLMQICFASALTITSVNSVPSEVQPGEKLTLNLNIENDLSQDIENAIVSLVLSDATSSIPFAPYQSSNEYMIEEISKDDREKASFDLIALSDAVSGTYTIPVQISYRLANETNRSSQSLGVVSLIVNAKPKIDLSSENIGLIKGTKEKLTIKIVNSGMGESKFLSIKLKQVNGIKLVGSDSVYIGNIDSNDFDSAEFNVMVNANSLSSIDLPLEITYTDSMNNQIVEAKSVIVKVYSAQEAVALGLINKNNPFLIIISIVGLGCAYVIYRKIKKRNKNKRDSPQ
jgi:hypothetical protein